MDGWTDEQVDK